jgi:hypothetical protein
MRSQPDRLRILVSARPSHPLAWHLQCADASCCSHPTGSVTAAAVESRTVFLPFWKELYRRNTLVSRSIEPAVAIAVQHDGKCANFVQALNQVLTREFHLMLPTEEK